MEEPLFPTQNLSSSGREGENEMYIEISSADSAPHDPLFIHPRKAL